MGSFKPKYRGKRIKPWLDFKKEDAWASRHPEFCRRQGKPVYQPNAERLLWCSNEYATCGAVWRKRDGVWSCVFAAPIIRWMVGMGAVDAKMELVRRGYEFKWVGN